MKRFLILLAALLSLGATWQAEPRQGLDTGLRTSLNTHTGRSAADAFVCPDGTDFGCRLTGDVDQTVCSTEGWDVFTVNAVSTDTICAGGYLDATAATSVVLQETGELDCDANSICEFGARLTFVGEGTITGGYRPDFGLRTGASAWLCAVVSSSTSGSPDTTDLWIGNSAANAEDTGVVLNAGESVDVKLFYDPVDGGCLGQVYSTSGTLLGSARNLLGATVGGDPDIAQVGNFITRSSVEARNVYTCEGGCGAAQTNEPNILLVRLDDVGRSTIDIAAFATPSLDALEDVGQRYTNFYTSALCAPTSLMYVNGVMPTAGIAFAPQGSSDQVQLGEALQLAGYSVRDWIGKYSLYADSASQVNGARAWIEAGGTFYEGAPAATPLDGDGVSGLTDWADWYYCTTTNPNTASCSANTDFNWQATTDMAVARILNTPVASKAFWGVGLNCVHTPEIDPSAGAPYTSAAAANCGGANDYDCLEVMTESCDTLVGELIAAVPNKGNTVVIAFSDNGTWSTSAAHYDAANVDGQPKGDINDEATRTIMWAAYGGVTDLDGGSAPLDMVSAADLFPTLAAIGGFDTRTVTTDDAGAARFETTQSFWDRLNGTCATDNCAFTDRRWLSSGSSNAAGDEPTEYALWDRENPDCKMICDGTANPYCLDAGANPYLFGSSESFDTPDETTPAVEATCVANRWLMENQLQAFIWNRKSWCPDDATICEDFEMAEADCNNLRAIGYGTVDNGCAETTDAIVGTYSMKVSGPGTSDGWWYDRVNCDATGCRITGYLKLTGSASLGNENLVEIWAGDFGSGGSQCALRLNTSGAFVARTASSGTPMTLTAVIDTVYQFTLDCNTTTNTATLTIYDEDGTLLESVSDAGSMGTLDELWFIAGATTWQPVFDNLVVLPLDSVPVASSGFPLTFPFAMQ